MVESAKKPLTRREVYNIMNELEEIEQPVTTNSE
jgi:hypothetical protein